MLSSNAQLQELPRSFQLFKTITLFFYYPNSDSYLQNSSSVSQQQRHFNQHRFPSRQIYLNRPYSILDSPNSTQARPILSSARLILSQICLNPCDMGYNAEFILIAVAAIGYLAIGSAAASRWRDEPAIFFFKNKRLSEAIATICWLPIILVWIGINVYRCCSCQALEERQDPIQPIALDPAEPVASPAEPVASPARAVPSLPQPVPAPINPVVDPVNPVLNPGTPAATVHIYVTQRGGYLKTDDSSPPPYNLE